MKVSPKKNCVNGECSLSFSGPFNPKIGPEWKDTLDKNPCIRYCARLHEWVHYNDNRSFNSTWGPGDQERFIEFPAYMLEMNCLAGFL